MRLLAIGKAGNGPEAELFSRYAARIKPTLTLAEFSPGQGSVAEIKRREAELLLGALHPQDFVIALDYRLRQVHVIVDEGIDRCLEHLLRYLRHPRDVDIRLQNRLVV